MGLTFLIAFLPLVAFLVNGICGSLFGLSGFRNRSHYVGVTAVGASMLLSFYVLFKVTGGEVISEVWFSWLISGGLSASFGGYVDSLTAVMLVVVTLVSFLVHVYSVGYMHEDPGYDRFFAYLGLFTFSMLVLVLSPNFLQLFFGWEAVGLSSYLLIGFWYKKKSAADAAVKAFLMNRVGDFLFILGVVSVFWVFGSLDFHDVFSKVPEVSVKELSIIALLLLGGAVGKSAQFPLHTWLPDAMEGPTPISALIHAATMVAAGVFMVARCAPIYEASQVLTVVGVIGVITAFGAATIGLTQFDIKRVLAYSTLSQLGYMFAALGVGAYVYAMFHLFTHAFFKALLFLGSGSVIHAMGGEQDIRKMGGLYKYMKVTAVTFIVGALALSGIPPLAGFFSKDKIITSAFGEGHLAFWFFLTAGTFLTSLYMGRLIFLVFFGEERFGDEVRKHLHESPPVMTVPLLVLAVLSLFAGFLEGWFVHFVGNSVPNVSFELSHSVEVFLVLTSIGLSLLGIFVAAYIYLWRKASPEKIATLFGPLYRLVYNKYYFDEVYDFLFVRGVGFVTGKALALTDKYVIDGVVNGLAATAKWSGELLRLTQTGVVNTYVAYMVIGMILFAVIIWLY
ncbi:NADH-quinone oxidoreductase subunit L [Phorcysia thermohydrogeniphila]|uniref:NADH-quinone oxidoreductase subunit L n=1 Tax=Phorcysia thermohydrogeniphila TaxID=936138 RepID=A0A4R1GBK3_9BACT|nr:NADH-quinone oxidoreductase subunit L [Phorcysia thermohydrogeniphila]TCK05414.1 NADH-quinone oxidoreductase subunit L [Phorcysia thermohydrogeniphila]